MTRKSLDQWPRRRHTLAVVLAVTMVALTFLLFSTKQARSHGFPIIDGAFTGDWCAPLFKGAGGPDSYLPLAMPACPLGDELFWDDWDAAFYGFGIADTMGWLLGGVPGAPVSDPEVDISFFATTADTTAVYYVVELGPFPSTIGVPPHIQIAIDIDGAIAGTPLWYDPAAVGTLPMGLAALPPLAPDYLITSDVLLGVATVWEATTLPGFWTMVGPVPLGWSGFTGGPGIIEVAVPWPMFAPGPPYPLGIPAHTTVMSAHSLPFLGLADAPASPQDDIISEIGAGFTTSPDVCPPGPPSTDCELFLGPGGGAGSQDAFLLVAHPPLPDFILNGTPLTQPVCVANDAVYEIAVMPVNAFAGPVGLALGGEPVGSSVSFSPGGAIVPYTSTLTVTNFLSNTVGSYSMAITGTWMTVAHTTTIGLDVIDIPPTISLIGPANGAIGVSIMPTFTWQAETTANTYALTVATDAGFTNVVVSATGINGAFYTLSTPLDSGTVYYWRVRGNNMCGPGSFSATRSFTTAWLGYLPVVVRE